MLKAVKPTDPTTRPLLIQVEHYIDGDPKSPEAYNRFLTRMGRLHEEYAQWRTLVFDSVTFMELMARKWHQYGLNPDSREPRQWFAGSTDLLEEMLLLRGGSLPMNVLALCHVDEEKDELHGGFVRNPAAPGRMRKRLGAGYAEVWRAYVDKDEDGKRVYQLQTMSSNQYAAATQINAPDPCYPSYKALWQPGERKRTIHGVVYGEWGSGKSTLAATFPKPILVMAFDPFGKETPYLRAGTMDTLHTGEDGTPIRRVWGKESAPAPGA